LALRQRHRPKPTGLLALRLAVPELAGDELEYDRLRRVDVRVLAGDDDLVADLLVALPRVGMGRIVARLVRSRNRFAARDDGRPSAAASVIASTTSCFSVGSSSSPSAK
jgi:hypothetical protein